MASGLWKRAKEQGLVAQKLGQEREINRVESGGCSINFYALDSIFHTVRIWKKFFIPTEHLLYRIGAGQSIVTCDKNDA